MTTGPPEDGDDRAALSPVANVERPPNHTDAPSLYGSVRVEQLRRRRQASCRLPALPCNCREVWPHRCDRRDRPPLSACQVDGAAAAARHLLDSGVPPRLPIETIRAVWRRGDRVLAQTLYELAGGD